MMFARDSWTSIRRYNSTTQVFMHRYVAQINVSNIFVPVNELVMFILQELCIQQGD